MSKPVEPNERCMAKVGFYGKPCKNRHLAGIAFCGVHKSQEQAQRDYLAAARARRLSKTETK